jgi:hypothetical protein
MWQSIGYIYIYLNTLTLKVCLNHLPYNVQILFSDVNNHLLINVKAQHTNDKNTEPDILDFPHKKNNNAVFYHQ